MPPEKLNLYERLFFDGSTLSMWVKDPEVIDEDLLNKTAKKITNNYRAIIESEVQKQKDKTQLKENLKKSNFGVF